jgi:hypothetical protein
MQTFVLTTISQRLITILIMFFMVVTVLCFSIGQVAAESISKDPVQAECFRVVANRIKSAVCAGDSHSNKYIQAARNGATYKCAKVDSGSKSACVNKYAEQYIDQTAAQEKKKASDFYKTLTAKITKAGGNPTKAAAGSKQGIIKGYNVQTSNSCGGPGEEVATSINFGCSHKGNAILDATFAIIRFLSNGVGLVLIGSLVYGGIQYTMSQGDPQAMANAVKRFRSVMFALLLFIFAYALLNYLIPGVTLQ